MTKLTDVDVQRSLDAFAEGVEEVGPTVRDFQTARGLSSTSVAKYHLTRLEREGLIERIPARRVSSVSRGYRLTALGRERAQRDAAVRRIA